jgi:phosphonate transport system substrate-binding protein
MSAERRIRRTPLVSFFRVLAFLACAALGFSGQALAVESAGERPLVFGVLNQQSPIKTAERWNPILRYLTRKTGIPLRLKMGPTVEETDRMMGREEFDLVFTNHNFQKEYDGKYRVLVHWAGEAISGVVIVLADSPVNGIRDLEGLTVAFPSSEAFLAYAVPKVALKEAGVSVTEKFAGCQEGALAQLKARQVQAAAVNSRYVEPYARRENLNYRTIHASEAFHELPVVVHPRVPANKVAALKHALLSMQLDPGGAEVLKLSGCPGFEDARESDYDNVRRIYRATGQ